MKEKVGFNLQLNAEERAMLSFLSLELGDTQTQALRTLIRNTAHRLGYRSEYTDKLEAVRELPQSTDLIQQLAY